METTLCIIKPDAVKNGFEDKINEKQEIFIRSMLQNHSLMN